MSPLDEILELTDAVEAAIEAGDWPAAGVLNGRRQNLLQELFAGRAPGDLDARTREVRRDVLDRNQATVSRLQGQQRAVASATQRLNQGGAAVRAYARNAAARPEN